MKNLENLLEKKFYKWDIWRLILFLVSFFILLCLIKPYLEFIALGFILGYILHPIHKKLKNIIKNDITSAIIVMSIFFLPLILFSLHIIQWFFTELVNIYLITSNIKIGLTEIEGLPPYFHPSIIIWSILQKISESISSFSAISAKKFLELIIKFLILLVVCFFSIIEGSEWRKLLIKSIPQEKRVTFLKFINRLDEVYYNIFIAQLYTAIIVFFMALVFFSLLKVEYILTYSIASFLFALIPIFDAWMICLLVALLEFLKGNIMKAIIISTVGSFLLSVIPGYIIRPKIAQKRGKVHGGLIFIGYLIGPFVMGIAGFLIVPALFGLFQVTLEFLFEEKEK